MSKLFKVGGFFIALGILTMVGSGIASGNWNDLYQTTNKFVEGDPYHSVGTITTIDVDASNRRIVLLPTSEEKAYVTYYESDFDHINITENNEVLKISNPVEWQANFIFSLNWFNFGEERTVHIYLPTSGSFNVDVYTKNGAISMANMDNLLTINVKTLNGAINLSQLPNVTSVRAESANGTISVTGTMVTNGLEVKTSNGGITIGSQSSANTIKATTSNGAVNVKDTAANDYDLASSNGNVELTAIGPMEDYYVTMHTINGGLYLNGSKTTTNAYGAISSPKRIDMSTSNGDVRLRFVTI